MGCACCFVYVVVFLQCVSGCVVYLSGCLQVCAVHVGLCALERDVVGGSREVLGKRECVEGGVCLAGSAGVLSSQAGSPELVAGTGGAFQLGAKLVIRTPIPMKY